MCGAFPFPAPASPRRSASFPAPPGGRESLAGDRPSRRGASPCSEAGEWWDEGPRPGDPGSPETVMHPVAAESATPATAMAFVIRDTPATLPSPGRAVKSPQE
ncbi:hypothetical protein TPA0909_22840 [Streptomyces albus]|nr:hypothetical protein TPA0909_22840 [Streptomyces albus]